MTDNINKHFHIQNKKYNPIKHKKYFKPCTYIAPFILCLTLSGCNNNSHYNINNVLSQANIVSKNSSEKQYVSSKEIRYAKYWIIFSFTKAYLYH